MDKKVFEEEFKKLLSQVNLDGSVVGKRLNQNPPEFMDFLRFSKEYLDKKKVIRPVVVEIGILDGMQKRFYEQLLDAQYYSIDIDPKSSATIKGDSTASSTIRQLKTILGRRKIDLLFIDGLHTYNGVEGDFDAYYPLTQHLIGVHDIFTPKIVPQESVDVMRWWSDYKKLSKDKWFEIQHPNDRPETAFNGRPLGIGIVVKEGLK